jgi:oxalate decarboxylase/phosphoglucose isomerase-like protein (cupin superfamily)
MEYKHAIQEISQEGLEFLKTLTPKEYERHLLAQKMLGSSYFVEKTPQFKTWKQRKVAEASTLKSPPQAAK